MDVFKNVIKKDPHVRVKINDMLDRYNRLPLKYHSKKGYNSLIQNVILEDLINKMGPIITVLAIEVKMKICRIECLEGKK